MIVVKRQIQHDKLISQTTASTILLALSFSNPFFYSHVFFLYIHSNLAVLLRLHAQTIYY